MQYSPSINEDELKTNLIQIATSSDCMILSFIAPDIGIRLSPIHYKSTSISVTDLYRIEEEFEKYGGELPKKLHIIIHTPGGEVYSTVKIAKYLRSKFDFISAYIPYEAASGGTMLCLVADEIIMSEVANLTPIDPQVIYKGQRIGVGSYKRAINELNKKLDKLSKDEVTSPYTDMCEKLDPVVWQEMEKSNREAVLTAIQLLQSHSATVDKDNVIQIARELALPTTTHSHVIDFNEAKAMGLNVIQGWKDPLYSSNLTHYKQFVRIKLKEESISHIIESFLPSKLEKNEETTQEPGTPTKSIAEGHKSAVRIKQRKK